MADEKKFAEGGAKMLASVAAFAVGGPVGIVGAIGFVSGVVNFMTSDSTTADALKEIKSQIEKIKTLLTRLDQRMDELVQQVAIESNRQTLARLQDHLDDIQLLGNRLHDQPQDIDTAVQVANELGVIIDKFLRTDFELWRWTDIIEKDGQPALLIGRFKNVPTLPIYMMGVLTWLAARERVVRANQGSRLNDDAVRISRHLNTLLVRNNFDKYCPDFTPDIIPASDPCKDKTGRPTTIAENIKWRIRAFPVSSNKISENRICHFFYEVQNWMNGSHIRGDNFDVVTGTDNEICRVDPFLLGTPNLELDWEAEAGIAPLRELADILTRVEVSGTVKEPFVGVFPPPEGPFFPSTLYFVAQNGNLNWYRNDFSSRPGGSRAWSGPNTIGTGWQGARTVFNAGGVAMYVVQQDGTLHWLGYSGASDGSPTWLNDAQPKQVSNGWNDFKSVFPGGEFVIYAITFDGRLLWFRHLGGGNGGTDEGDWAGPIEVSSGWGDFPKVFSAGEGVIYVIDANGTMFRAVHKGYLTGTPQWETDELVEIAGGWNIFSHVVAGADGVIYGFTRDGRVFHTRFAKRRPEPAGQTGGLGGLLNPDPVFVPGLPAPLVWEGPPVEIKHNMPGFLSVFAQMDKPDEGIA